MAQYLMITRPDCSICLTAVCFCNNQIQNKVNIFVRQSAGLIWMVLSIRSAPATHSFCIKSFVCLLYLQDCSFKNVIILSVSTYLMCYFLILQLICHTYYIVAYWGTVILLQQQCCFVCHIEMSIRILPAMESRITQYMPCFW